MIFLFVELPPIIPESEDNSDGESYDLDCNPQSLPGASESISVNGNSNVEKSMYLAVLDFLVLLGGLKNQYQFTWMWAQHEKNQVPYPCSEFWVLIK